jgi:glutathione peroxidase
MRHRLLPALALWPMLFAPADVSAARDAPANAFDFAFVAIDGAPMPLADWRGKVLLVVNTASFCGFTGQYEALQKLHETYQARGLVVVGVPSNDFGSQEPKANSEIAEFCQGAFNVTFPLTEKQTVRGVAAHPFYVWARTILGEAAAPRWNFHKYLVGREGKLVAAFSSATDPRSLQVVTAIEQSLGR